jgi:flagellar hook-basal body complex protein FliE
MAGPLGSIGAAAGAAAYRAAQALPAAGAGAGGAPDAGGGFGAVMQRALEGTVEASRSADAASGAALLGQVGVTEAVLAVSRAELSLQTAVALRDRVVAAYQDVMRMPI